ncbi:MAG TPA: glycosyltransferase family 4 protein [Bacteroidales bacterium]
MPYTIGSIKMLINIGKVDIHIIHYPVSNDAPYQLPSIKGVTYYDESKLTIDEIESLINKLIPRFIFITGWSNSKYLKIALFAKKQRIPVVSGCDTQWRGDMRQIVAVVLSKILIRKYFDFIMVPGVYQYEYARLLRYKKEQILFPLYTADLSFFNKKYTEFLSLKQSNYPRNLLFVGRFEKIKGIHLLIEAFMSIHNKKGWTLTLVGNGSIKKEINEQIKGNKEIVIKDFLQPEKLAEEIKISGAFCLPSVYEPWGVVIQEFASAGLPIISSNVCGASNVFVKENFNGFLFNSKHTEDLKIKIEKLINLSDDKLLQYSERSNFMAQSIKPEMYAANFSRFLSD